MATIKARLETLERTNRPDEDKRLYCVTGGSETDSAEAFVRAQGYAFDATDMVIHIVGFQPTDGQPNPWAPAMQWCGPTPPDKWRVAA